MKGGRRVQIRKPSHRTRPRREYLLKSIDTYNIIILYLPIILSVTKVPSGRLTDNRLSRKFLDHRIGPKRWRHRTHVQRNEKLFGHPEHSCRRVALCKRAVRPCLVIAWSAGARVAVGRLQRTCLIICGVTSR